VYFPTLEPTAVGAFSSAFAVHVASRRWLYGTLGRLSAGMRIWPFIILTALILAGCGHRELIDRIVKEDSADPHFPSGLSSLIRLPAAAPVAQVAAKALGLVETNITILETRQVHISHGDENKLVPPERLSYIAVLVDTGSGRKVVLLQFQQDSDHPPGGWWSRDYDL
jgi:hypothetical protein